MRFGEGVMQPHIVSIGENTTLQPKLHAFYRNPKLVQEAHCTGTIIVGPTDGHASNTTTLAALGQHSTQDFITTRADKAGKLTEGAGAGLSSSLAGVAEETGGDQQLVVNHPNPSGKGKIKVVVRELYIGDGRSDEDIISLITKA